MIDGQMMHGVAFICKRADLETPQLIVQTFGKSKEKAKRHLYHVNNRTLKAGFPKFEPVDLVNVTIFIGEVVNESEVK